MNEEKYTYHCDGCFEELPFDDVNWFTSSIGFCDSCDAYLHKVFPSIVLEDLYDICNGGNENDEADNAVALVIKTVQNRTV